MWRDNEEHAAHARTAEILLGLMQQGEQRLRAHATTFRGHSYLFVRWRKRWEEADSISRAVGGHLLTLSDEAEEETALGLLRPEGWVWLGLDRRNGRPVWVTDEPLDYIEERLPASDRGGHWVHWMRVMNLETWGRAEFLIEWDS